jgi:uncharacterized RDD family membrane protein YckC
MAGEQWFYARGGQQQGPVDSATLEQMLRLGSLSGADLVWREGMAQWLPASSQAELFAAAQAGPVGVQPQGQAAGPYALSYGGYQAYGAPEYAGFWLRFAAWIIDWLINFVASLFIRGIAGFMMGVGMSAGSSPNQAIFVSGMTSAVGLIIGWLYYALMESSSMQGTVGKLALSIKVTDMEGNRVSFGRATGRYFGRIISGLIVCVGFFMAGFTERKQALHDIMANTLVVRK